MTIFSLLLFLLAESDLDFSEGRGVSSSSDVLSFGTANN
jgi:hypothetical protein